MIARLDAYACTSGLHTDMRSAGGTSTKIMPRPSLGMWTSLHSTCPVLSGLAILTSTAPAFPRALCRQRLVDRVPRAALRTESAHQARLSSTCFARCVDENVPLEARTAEMTAILVSSAFKRTTSRLSSTTRHFSCSASRDASWGFIGLGAMGTWT